MIDKKKVLFVCIENAGRSQMAEAFAKRAFKGTFESFSAGSKPSNAINPVVVVAMKEIGIDISGNQPKGFSDLPSKGFEYVITMGCGDSCPIIPAKEHIDWDIEDPKNKDITIVRKIRDDIAGKVRSLYQKISEQPCKPSSV